MGSLKDSLITLNTKTHLVTPTFEGLNERGEQRKHDVSISTEFKMAACQSYEVWKRIYSVPL